MHGLLLVTAILTTAFLIYGLYQLNQRVVRLEDRKRQIASITQPISMFLKRELVNRVMTFSMIWRVRNYFML